MTKLSSERVEYLKRLFVHHRLWRADYAKEFVAHIDALEAENAVLEKVADAIIDIIRDNRGVEGWHKNDAIAEWNEFDGLMDALKAAGRLS